MKEIPEIWVKYFLAQIKLHKLVHILGISFQVQRWFLCDLDVLTAFSEMGRRQT